MGAVNDPGGRRARVWAAIRGRGDPSREPLSRWQRVGEPILVVVLLILGWEFLTRSEILPSRDLPPSSAIGAAFIGDLEHERLWAGVLDTLISWAMGVSAATIIGIPVGLLLGSSRIAYLITQPSLEFIRTIPSIAALPLLILLLGSRGPQLAATMAFLGAVWPILIQSLYGVRDVDPVTKDAGRAYGLGRLQLFARIVIPSALPYIATGMRLGVILGLLLSVAASLIAGGNGLGFLIISASLSGVRDLVFARILVTGIIGLALTMALVAIESRVLFWHGSHRATRT